MTKRVTRPKKKTGRKPRKHDQQETSASAIVRAKVTEMALAFRLQGYTTRQILEAVNEAFGPTADEPLIGFKAIKSPTTITRYIMDAIADAVDPMKKEELLELHTMQTRQIFTAMIGPAMGGSVAHASLALQALEREAKLLKLHDKGDGQSGVAGVQVFINGALANV